MAKTHKRMARLERMMAKLLAEVAYLKDELITKPEAERVLKRLQEEDRMRSIQEEVNKLREARNTLSLGKAIQEYDSPRAGAVIRAEQMRLHHEALERQRQMRVYQQQLLGSLGGNFEKFEKHMVEHVKEMVLDEDDA